MWGTTSSHCSALLPFLHEFTDLNAMIVLFCLSLVDMDCVLHLLIYDEYWAIMTDQIAFRALSTPSSRTLLLPAHIYVRDTSWNDPFSTILKLS